MELVFGDRVLTPDVRGLYDMKEVIHDKIWLKGAENVDLYYMYRDLSVTPEDGAAIRDMGLRYDITVIPPRTLGAEYVKTLGHYHPLIEGTSMTYPEVYEVINGEAHYLLQKEEEGEVTDVALIRAEKGDKVVMPPNYGHVTINPAQESLKMANFVVRDFSSIYRPFKEKGGASYFELVGNELLKNPSYGYLPEVRVLKPANFYDVGFEKGVEMYGIIKKHPSLLEFLMSPQNHAKFFKKVLEFRG